MHEFDISDKPFYDTLFERGPMVSTAEFNYGGWRSFAGKGSIYLLFISDIVNFLFKTSGGETQGLILLFL